MKQTNRNWRRTSGLLLTILLLSLSSFVWAEEGGTVPGADTVLECESMDELTESENLSFYLIPEDQREPFYDDFTTFQRSGSGEAYAVFELPGLDRAAVVTNHQAEQLVDFTFSVSEDGEAWENAEAEAGYLKENGKWTVAEYCLTGLSHKQYLKVIWPDTKDYWTPLLSKLVLWEPVPSGLVIECDSTLTIPMYDSAYFPAAAYPVDQKGKRMEGAVRLEITESSFDGPVLTEDGRLEIREDDPDGGTFTLTARLDIGDGQPLTAEQTVLLETALLGDLNGDLIVDRADLEFAASWYGKDRAAAEWVEIRLADLDRDGRVGIIDLAYLAKQIKSEESNL